MPTAAPGFAVKAFASGLDHPRWLYVLPNGVVLVAETHAPPKPDDRKGITPIRVYRIDKPLRFYLALRRDHDKKDGRWLVSYFEPHWKPPVPLQQ